MILMGDISDDELDKDVDEKISSKQSPQFADDNVVWRRRFCYRAANDYKRRIGPKVFGFCEIPYHAFDRR